MKKCLLLLGSLMVASLPDASGTFTDESSYAERVKTWIRAEGEISETTLSQMPYDAFLSEAGYVVYPIEEDYEVLQSKIAKNPMVLHKEFIPRHVRILRRLESHRPDGSAKGGFEKQLVIVNEVGSVSQFMVDSKDLHFAQGKRSASENSK